jgi:Na+/alanine symporter
MSTTRESSIDEREWQAQERGMRSTHDNALEDSLTQHYRVVANALYSSLRSQPPDNFASTVAQLAATRSNRGLERMLLQMLLIVFAISSIIVFVLYGGRWWQSLHQTFASDALAWLLASMSCLLVSWVFGQLHYFRDDRSPEAVR